MEISQIIMNNKTKTKLERERMSEEFDKFITKWCGNMSSHLLDSDDNDGEYFREKLRNMGGIPINDFNEFVTKVKLKARILYGLNGFIDSIDRLASEMFLKENKL